MKRILLVAMLLFAGSVLAQTVCDVVYTTDINVIEQGVERDVVTATTTVYGVPMADVLDNSTRALRIVNIASTLQDKGGPYNIETGEVRSCDGKPPERVAATSLLFKGVTLQGSNKIARTALKEADGITHRYEERQAKGAKHGWDHSKARKTKRDDLGRKSKD